MKKICSVDYSRKKFQKQHSAKEKEERYNSSLPCFSFQTIKGTPDWPFGSTFPAVPPSIHKCCRKKCPILQNNKKRARKRSDLKRKKCHFHHFSFFFINSFFSFKSNFKVHGWGKLLLHSLFVSFFIFRLFCYLFIFFMRNEVALLPFPFSLFKPLRREPFCLASVAFGTAFPGHWSGSCSGVLPRWCLCEPCPCKGWGKEPFRTGGNNNKHT